MGNKWFYSLYALILGMLALYTKEIVTFIMLGIILMSLVNIQNTLKAIYEKMKEKDA